MKKFIVPIVYRGLSNFIVEAEDEGSAKKKAETRFNDGDEPEMLGNEWEEIERIGEIEETNNE